MRPLVSARDVVRRRYWDEDGTHVNPDMMEQVVTFGYQFSVPSGLVDPRKYRVPQILLTPAELRSTPRLAVKS